MNLGSVHFMECRIRPPNKALQPTPLSPLRAAKAVAGLIR